MATDLRISVPLARLPSTAIHWHLLLCGRPDARGTPASSPPTARYRRTAPDPRGRAQRSADVGGQAFARLGVKQTAHYLIRPDGHVGYRAAGTDLDGLQRHLAHWLPHPHRIQPKQRSPSFPPSPTHLSLSTGQASNPVPP